MKLYYSPGACSLGVHIVLREADRLFDLERVDFRTHRTASGADYYEINPKGYVPALRLDGPGSPVLTEAPAILLYIADLTPERALAPPSGTFARYHMLEWLTFIAAEVHKPFSPLFHPETPAPTAERARASIGRRFTYVAQVLTDRAYLMGEHFTVADAYLYPMLRWCERFEIDLPLWPNIDDYFQRLSDRETIAAAVAAEGLQEHRRMRRTA